MIQSSPEETLRTYFKNSAIEYFPKLRQPQFIIK